MTTKRRASVPSTTWWPMTNGWKQSSFPSAMASRCCGNDRHFGRRSYTTAMKYLIASLFLFLCGHSSLSSHPCYIGTEEYNNVVEQKDSVLRARISSNTKFTRTYNSLNSRYLRVKIWNTFKI